MTMNYTSALENDDGMINYTSVLENGILEKMKDRTLKYIRLNTPQFRFTVAYNEQSNVYPFGYKPKVDVIKCEDRARSMADIFLIVFRHWKSIGENFCRYMYLDCYNDGNEKKISIDKIVTTILREMKNNVNFVNVNVFNTSTDRWVSPKNKYINMSI